MQTLMPSPETLDGRLLGGPSHWAEQDVLPAHTQCAPRNPAAQKGGGITWTVTGEETEAQRIGYLTQDPTRRPHLEGSM